MPAGTWRRLDGEQKEDAFLSILYALADVDAVYACADDEGYRQLTLELEPTPALWPIPGAATDRDTLLRVQTMARESGTMVWLNLDAEILAWAKDKLYQRFGNKQIVALHLKNVPNNTGGRISVANSVAWKEFLVRAAQYDVQFVLIGDDPVDVGIATLPNVALAREMNATPFAKHLAFIAVADGFMGMMSGPSNFAILSPKPYVLFKNQDHHREEMLKEIGIDDRYSFALSGQKIQRVNETAEILLSELLNMPFLEAAARNSRLHERQE
jgi:hypothetical protein